MTKTFAIAIRALDLSALLRAFWLPVGLIVLYLLLVGAVFVAVERRDRTKPEYRTARDLPANSRIREHDVVRPRNLSPGYFWHLPDFDKHMKARYVHADLKADQPIGLNDLRAAPGLPVAPTVTLPLDQQAGLAELLNAGSKVRLCPGDKCYDAITSAVICGANDKSCYGLFALPENDAIAVQRAKGVVILITGVASK